MHALTPIALGFRSPGWLLALGLIPLAIFAYLSFQGRRRQYALRFASLPTLASVMPRSPGWRRHAAPLVLLLALAALVLALAKPDHDVEVPRERASIMLVTDTSGSMAAEDVAPNRLRAAQNAAASFLERVPKQIRVGLVQFSSTAATLQTPTIDRQAVLDALGTIVAGGGTATGDGLTAALTALNRQNEGKSAKERVPGAIVLLSDGKASTGVDPLQVAAEAAQAKIPIYTVALGTPDGFIETPGGGVQAAPPDPEALREIAQASGGKFFDAPSASSLQDAYQDLGSRLGKDKESREITRTFAGIGLLLLLAGGALGLAWTGRLP